MLGDSSILANLTASDIAMLKALSQSSGATQTPVQFQDALYSMAANGAASPVA